MKPHAWLLSLAGFYVGVMAHRETVTHDVQQLVSALLLYMGGALSS